jgi:hypothetical protein
MSIAGQGEENEYSSTGRKERTGKRRKENFKMHQWLVLNSAEERNL